MTILTADNVPGVHVQRRGDGMFPLLYRSSAFVYAATGAASAACFAAVSTLLETNALDWLVPLPTYTSRQLFIGRLNDGLTILPDLIFKQSRFHRKRPQTALQAVNSCVEEIRMSLALAALIDDLQVAGRLLVPAGFMSVTVRVETPLGVLIDRVHQSRYSVFAFEPGLDTGELLLYSDPPFHGAANYSKHQWQVYCAIMGLLDIIAAAALKRNIQLDDLDVHQVLYRAPEQEPTLDMVLIDAERIHAI